MHLAARPACGIRCKIRPRTSTATSSALPTCSKAAATCYFFFPPPPLPGIKHFVYASSSSVYGANKKLPFAVDDPVDHPLSLYAATNKGEPADGPFL